MTKHKKITIDGQEYDLAPTAEKVAGFKKVHAGYNPVTGKALFCADADLPKVMKYVDAQKYIKENCVGWRLPTLMELQVMYWNRETIGGFNVSRNGSDVAHYYWSCSEHRDDASIVDFVDFTGGVAVWGLKDYGSLSSRLVWAEAE